MSTIELIAVVFGLLSVVLTIRQSIWCWPTGLVQVILFIGIFYDAKLYSDMILHVIYIFLQFYGWYYWLRGDKGTTPPKVESLSPIMLASWGTAVAVLSALWGYVMYRWTDASFAFADAFIMVASLAAQWLLAQKKLQSWWFWIAVDLVAIFVYWQKDLKLTSLLYVVFLVLAGLGWWTWKTSRQQTRRVLL
jgi:nicotinamide mononucleotide transporter